MLREAHILDEIYVHRYHGPDPSYAIVLCHGIGGHGGIYDRFCVPHAMRGVDIWSLDAPGHGQSTLNRPRGQWTLGEYADAAVMVAEHVAAETGLPVFVLGSSMGVAAGFSALHSDVVRGAILMGSPMVPQGPWMSDLAGPWQTEGVQQMLAASWPGRAARLDVSILFDFDEDYGYSGAGEQKRGDPWNTWSYDLSSWASLFTYQPKIPPSENRKPILMASGAEDPVFTPDVMETTARAIAGPVTFHCFEGGKHQLMLFSTERFSALVHEWVGEQLGSRA
ncbi:alpha/beta hydrolase [Sphingobium baderi]|uniref:Lysophospholipase n=1 Tax=Sphingobium baderi TaxID=1332080 RepID=A0A0S3EUG9_9SPHN|nr:alpha/beta fold hydrolase [Sphingobium baderi]ALR19078.1 lysophospholipase [Sphingobium baderi]AMT81322.1 lysophospholipase [Sphingobium baderi]ARR53371.1 alpha/beta hydrolase [Rhizorhabdus wittichii DC-6]ARR57548.1 alpha/beta hydrolase [Rhizorhabdus wittichii DC-6]